MNRSNKGNRKRRRQLSLTTLVVAVIALVMGSMVMALAQAADNGANPPNTLFLPLVQQPSSAQAAIDPRVLEDTADGQVGHFLVLLKDQAPVRDLVSSGG